MGEPCVTPEDIMEIKMLLNDMSNDQKHLLEKINNHEITLFGNGSESSGLKYVVQKQEHALNVITYIGLIVVSTLTMYGVHALIKAATSAV